MEFLFVVCRQNFPVQPQHASPWLRAAITQLYRECRDVMGELGMLGKPTPFSTWAVLPPTSNWTRRKMGAKRKICEAVARMLMVFELVSQAQAWPIGSEGTLKEIVEAATLSASQQAWNEGNFGGPGSFEIIMKVSLEIYEGLVGIEDDIPYTVIN